MTNDSKISAQQKQVEELESTSAEKDTLIAKYETIVEESECENILNGMKYTNDVNFHKH